MADRLPPDLARLGDQITAAAERSLQERRRRGVLGARLAATAVAAVAVLAVLAPGGLRSAQRALDPSRVDRASDGSIADGRSAGAEGWARAQVRNSLRPGPELPASRPTYAGDQRAAFNLRVGTHR